MKTLIYETILAIVILSLWGCVNDNKKETIHHFNQEYFENFLKDDTIIYSNKYIVPNKEVAIKIAEILLPNIYGNSVLDEKPFNAQLINDTTWVVFGTCHYEVGGVAYIFINKKNCQVIKYYHDK